MGVGASCQGQGGGGKRGERCQAQKRGISSSKDLGGAIQDAKKLKLDYVAADYQATRLSARIKNAAEGQPWGWAHGPDSVGQLTAAHKAMETVAEASAWQACLEVADVADLKQTYEPDTFLAELNNSTEKLRAPIARVLAIVSGLKQQQALREEIGHS